MAYTGSTVVAFKSLHWFLTEQREEGRLEFTIGALVAIGAIAAAADVVRKSKW